MKKFSIVIPVYNVENYLMECVNSILNQTFDDYEILLIDDGSTDKSGTICDEIAYQNDKIKVIHKKNGGLSSARNEGIRQASGEYIIFLDSDDYWNDYNALYKFAKLLDENNSDVLIFGMKKYFEDIDKYEKCSYKKNNFDNLTDMIKQEKFKASANNKIVKLKFIKEKKILFPINKLSEDITWCMYLIDKCEKFFYFDEKIYVYRQRNGSITHSKNIKHIYDILEQCSYGIEEYKKSSKKETIYSFLDYEYCTAIFLSTYKCFSKDTELRKKINECKLLLNYGVSKKTKIIKLFNNIIGFKGTYKLLSIYYKIKCK